MMDSAAEKATLPRRASEVSAVWLTSVVSSKKGVKRPRGSDAGVDESKSSIDLTKIGTNEGFLGSIFRTRIRDRPIIVKFPPHADDNAEVAAVVRQFDLHVKECLFYQHIAPHLSCLAIPGCLFSHADPERGDGVMVLEDLAPARVIPFVKGLSEAEARAALQAIACLHCHSLDVIDSGKRITLQNKLSQVLHDVAARKLKVAKGDGPVVASGDPPTASASMSGESMLDAFYSPGLGTFLTSPVFAPLLPDPESKSETGGKTRLNVDHVNALRRWSDPSSTAAMRRRLATESSLQTIIHGDLWSSNLLFDTSSSKKASSELRGILDWQCVGIGHPLLDVAFLLTSSVAYETRSRHQTGLLRAYHESLTSHRQHCVPSSGGATMQYSFDQCQKDFDICLILATMQCIASVDIFSVWLTLPATSTDKTPQKKQPAAANQELLQRLRGMIVQACEAESRVLKHG